MSLREAFYDLENRVYALRRECSAARAEVQSLRDGIQELLDDAWTRLPPTVEDQLRELLDATPSNMVHTDGADA